jgi:hypothetical protein
MERNVPCEKPRARGFCFRAGVLDVGIDRFLEQRLDFVEGPALDRQIEVEAKRLPPIAGSAGNAKELARRLARPVGAVAIRGIVGRFKHLQ